MSTTTTRLALVKEIGAENYSVVTVNNNLDKVDAAVGWTACTSSTRPAAPYNGQGIRETDTGSYYVSNGTIPASGSWRPIFGVDGPVIVGAVGASAPLRVQTTSTIAGNRLIDARKSTDTEAAWIVDFDGKHQWGAGGSTAPDTNLYRSAADTLKTDDALTVGGALAVTGSTVITGTLNSTAAAMDTLQSTTDTTPGTTTSTTATTALTGTSTVTLGFTAPPSGKILVTITAELQNSAANYTTMSFSISGSAGTVAHDDNNGLYMKGTDPVRASATSLVTGLTAGQAGTVTLSHLVTSGTGTFNRRRISVSPVF